MGYYGFGTKEAILNNLGTELEELTVNAVLIKFVEYQRSHFQGASPDKYPGVFVNDVRTDKVKMLSDITRNEFAAALIGFVWAKDSEELSTLVHAWIEAMKDKVIADRTRGSQAYDTEIQAVVTDGGNRHPQGQFIIMINIIYYSQE